MNGTAHPFSLLPCRPAPYFPRTACPDGGGERESREEGDFYNNCKVKSAFRAAIPKGRVLIYNKYRILDDLRPTYMSVHFLLWKKKRIWTR